MEKSKAKKASEKPGVEENS